MADIIAGTLEVGHNDQGEVVINHPDLKPDENGVGHIVFSPDQARRLASLLMKRAALIETEQTRKLEQDRRALAEASAQPVDYGARELVSALAGVPCFVKQLGSRPIEHSCRNQSCTHPDCGYDRVDLKDRKGGDLREWPAGLRVRQFPGAPA